MNLRELHVIHAVSDVLEDPLVEKISTHDKGFSLKMRSFTRSNDNTVLVLVTFDVHFSLDVFRKIISKTSIFAEQWRRELYPTAVTN